MQEQTVTISLTESCQGTSRNVTIQEAGIQGQLRIPAGTLSGETVSFTALGIRHRVKVRVEPDGTHRVEGRNLRREVRLYRKHSLTGREIALDTPRGPVKLPVTGDTKTGSVWTIKGYGIPDPGGGTPGDLIVTAQVQEETGPGCLILLAIAAGAIALIISSNFGARFPGSGTVREISGEAQRWLAGAGYAREPYEPATDAQMTELKHLMLREVNERRSEAGLVPVRMGNNPSPQVHAEAALEHCYSAHWDRYGLKPLYRYALTGGDQYADENVSGIDYCVKKDENYKVNSYGRLREKVAEAVEGWMNSPGHRRNILDPRHKVLHIGIAEDRHRTNMVQVFSGDYVSWNEKPQMGPGGTLTASGRMRGAYADPKSSNAAMFTVSYHRPTQPLTQSQLSRIYCLENDKRAGVILKPLGQGRHYPKIRGNRDFYEETVSNEQCIDPYELDPNGPIPQSWEEANEAHARAKADSENAPPEPSVKYGMVADTLAVGNRGTEFVLKTDVTPMLEHYGPGIYTLSLWATIEETGEEEVISEFPIWWETEPPRDHPYRTGK